LGGEDDALGDVGATVVVVVAGVLELRADAGVGAAVEFVVAAQ